MICDVAPCDSRLEIPGSSLLHPHVVVFLQRTLWWSMIVLVPHLQRNTADLRFLLPRTSQKHSPTCFSVSLTINGPAYLLTISQISTEGLGHFPGWRQPSRGFSFCFQLLRQFFFRICCNRFRHSIRVAAEIIGPIAKTLSVEPLARLLPTVVSRAVKCLRR